MIIIVMIKVVMILRVYALFNRSRFILGFLLLMYATEVIAFLIFCSVAIKSSYARGKLK